MIGWVWHARHLAKTHSFQEDFPPRRYHLHCQREQSNNPTRPPWRGVNMPLFSSKYRKPVGNPPADIHLLLPPSFITYPAMTPPSGGPRATGFVPNPYIHPNNRIYQGCDHSLTDGSDVVRNEHAFSYITLHHTVDTYFT